MSEISKQALLVDNSISFPDNNAGAITPSDLRAFNVNLIQSTVNQTEYTANSSSWNSTISQLNTFTASQQPSFNALNSFTASQLTINSGVNLFTQSAGNSISKLNQASASLENFTSSINQIIVNGESIGTSTRLFFNGYASASIIPNVDGPIASITILADQTFTPSASFNAYTASTNAWTASAKVSITNINSTTASLNTSVSNLNSFSSSTLISLNALNDFTASDNTSQLALNEFTSSQLDINDGYNTFTASAATTGSNIFVGDQTIFKANGKLGFQSGSSNTAAVSMTALGNLQLEVQNTQIALLEQNAIGLQKNTTVTGNVVVNGNEDILGLNATFNLMKNANYSGSQYPLSSIYVAPNVYPTDIYGGYTILTEQGAPIGATFLGMVSSTYSPQYGGTNTPMIIANGSNPGGNDTAIAWTSNGHADHWKVSNFKYGVNITGSTSLTGSLTITGSISNNIVSASIVSSTASIDLSKGNLFTLTLPASVTTNINVQNARVGQTALIKITTAGTAATASFSSNVYQPSASFYIPTNAAGTDILTLSTFDSSIVYLASVKTMINA